MVWFNKYQLSLEQKFLKQKRNAGYFCNYQISTLSIQGRNKTTYTKGIQLLSLYSSLHQDLNIDLFETKMSPMCLEKKLHNTYADINKSSKSGSV